MWGDYEVKFPQARALYMYMAAHPGKTLNFMGGEFAQFREWDEKRSQDWELMKYPLHDSFQKYFTELMKLTKQHPALYAEDYNSDSFKWLEVDAAEKCVYIFRRTSGNSTVVAAFNFSDKPQPAYAFDFGNADKGTVKLREILNSDWQEFSGNTPRTHNAVITSEISNGKNILKAELPAFSGRLFEVI